MPRIENSQLGQPQRGNIQLILYRPADDSLSLYLETSISHLESLCLHPGKFLRYLGWCVMGIEGRVRMDSPRSADDIGDNARLENQGVYSYRMAEGDDDPLGRVVSTNIFERASRRSTHSHVSDRRILREAVSERDACCIVTGNELAMCQASHITPFASKEASIQSIVASRPNYGDDVLDLTSIDDVRNGILVMPLIHTGLDLLKIAFLKTPNPVLHTDDVPIRANRVLMDDTAYPANERVTLQLIEDQGEPLRSVTLDTCKIGCDAAFAVDTGVPGPSVLLLDYKYGAAVIRWWGYHTDVLQSHERPQNPAPAPGPSTPGPSAPGPSTSASSNYPAGHHNLRESTMKKREHTDTAGGSKKKPRKKAVGCDVVYEPVRESTGWDEYDWLDFFMFNTKAARERRRAAEEESSSSIRAWAQGVSDSH